jgi:prophage DNA circulation protein
MAWQDEVTGKASFRGAEWDHISRKGNAGRRGTTDEFGGSDVPDGQDFGRRGKVFREQGIVAGDNYLEQLRRIEAACDAPGRGVYRDSYGRSWTVICRTFEYVEAVNKQGLATLTFVFEEAGGDDGATPDTGGLLLSAADNLDAAALAAFTQNFKMDGLPGFVATSAGDVAQSFRTGLKGIGQTMPQMVDSENPYIQSINGGLDGFKDYLDTGLDNDLGVQVQGTIQTVAQGVYTTYGDGDPSAAVSSMLRFSKNSFAIDEGSLTPQRQQQQKNGFVFDVLARSTALSQAVKALSVETFDSVDAGMSRGDEIRNVVDMVLRDTGGDGSVAFMDDDVYSAARAVGIAVSRHIEDKTGGLPRIVRKSLDASVPAVVAAFREYGDASRADDLVQRNPQWSKPLLPEGEELEWLSH